MIGRREEDGSERQNAAPTLKLRLFSLKKKKKVVEVLRINQKSGDVSETASHFWGSCDDETWRTKETFTKVLQSRWISFLSPFLSFLVSQILETSVNELFKMQTSFFLLSHSDT